MSTYATAPLTVRPSFITHHPFKFLYVLATILTVLPRIPIWILWYLSRRLRPHPQWSLRQALCTYLLKTVLFHYSRVEAREPLQLKPTRKDKHRFKVISPPDEKSIYTHHPLNGNEKIKPEPIGASWYPSAPPANLKGPVILHFHGGAFILGDGRNPDAQFLAGTLLEKTPAHYVLMPQYRLSGSHLPECRFPAAIQDAVTCYYHVTKTLGVPAEKVIVSGDSAGGNIVIALLRYISLYGSQIGLSAPSTALLWSPWVDPAGALDENAARQSPREPTDYISYNFGSWGTRVYTGGSGFSPEDPWVSPLRGVFRAQTKFFVHYGGVEMLSESIEKFIASMRNSGNELEVMCEELAVHDIVLSGWAIGWKDEAKKGAAKAGKWLEAQGVN